MIRKQKGRVKSGSTMVRPSKKKKNVQELFENIKIMLIIFFYIRGVIHHEFVPQGQTINAAFYVEVLKRLRQRVRRVRPEL